jgi:hypothetical protein
LDLNEILYPPGVQTISAHLGGDIFRLPWSVPLWETGDNATNLLDHLLSRVPAETDPARADASNTNPARLGAGQDCLMVSREPQRLRVGRSASSRTDLGDINEFVHLAVPATAAQLSLWKTRYGSKGLAVLLVFDPDGKETGEVVIVPVPSAISFGKDRLLIRINCGGLMELSREKIAGYGDATIDVWFAVLGWSGAWN